MSNPLLIFPKPSKIIPRTVPDPRPQPKFFGPEKSIQEARFNEKISNLDTVITNESIKLSQSVVGLEPERILVFEIKGEIIDFYKAVEKTEGMEFLAEFYVGEDDPDKDFIFRKFDNNNKVFVDDSRKIPRRLFLTINNNSALKELKGYWDNFKLGKDFKRGFTKFRTLFEQLNDVRYYSVTDRIIDTGIFEYFTERLKLNDEEIYFEIELSFRNDDKYLKNVYSHIKNLIEENKGIIIESSYVIIKEIKYHALIAKVPIGLFHDLKDDTNVSFFKCEQVLFFRPVGQSIVNHQVEEQDEMNLKELIESAQSAKLEDNPFIALLDGLPIQNHALLKDKLIIDDPDNYEDLSPSKSRFHGTAMASLVLFGDLNSGEINLLSRKLYVRPILLPSSSPTNNAYYESVPYNVLFIDIIHRAVKRIMDGNENENAITPSIKVINLSIGDLNRPFLFNNSSWSRLIDWLSFKYNILFIISSGNYVESIELELNGSSMASLTPEQKETLLIKSIINDNYKRKIIAPAESINAISVGAYNSDNYDGSILTNSYRVELLENSSQISPISRIGMGYLNSIKPDILLPGGKQLYRVNATNPNLFNIDTSDLAPGHKVAYPDSKNSNQGVHFTRGTSNSAALATRFAARISEVLEGLSFESLTIPDDFYPVIIKSLLVHGAINDNTDILFNLIGGTNKTRILPYIGHGFVFNENKVLTCTEQQVTLIGFGELNEDQSHIYELPLPSEISSQQISKQLTITIGWFTPINFMSNKYKKAALYIDNISGENSTEDDIDWNGSMYDYNASKRGTVQHLRYKGTGADAYIEDSLLKIKVNCREHAEKLSETIKYGIAVTFELIDNTTINIYDEIKLRIAEKIRIS